MCSAPLFIYRDLVHYHVNFSSLNFDHTIFYCHEMWPELPWLDGRVYYSIFSLTLQYFIPIFVVSSAYMKIYFRLKKRFVIQNVPSIDDRIQNRRGRRMKRTNCLLISIALIFGFSWLPLNFFNLYADLNGTKMTQTVYIIFAICHMAGMSSGKGWFSALLPQFLPHFLSVGEISSPRDSLNPFFFFYESTFFWWLNSIASTACSNPLLYGWLNDNFRKEFNEIMCCIKNNHDSSTSALKLKAIDASFAAKKRAYSEVTDIDKQSKLLLKPQRDDVQDFKSEYTLWVYWCRRSRKVSFALRVSSSMFHFFFYFH